MINIILVCLYMAFLTSGTEMDDFYPILFLQLSILGNIYLSWELIALSIIRQIANEAMIGTIVTSNNDSDKTISLVDRYPLVLWARIGMSIFASWLLMSVQVIYAPTKLVTNYDGSLTWKCKPPPSVPISMSYSKSSVLI
jgi:hypothetical protein